MVTESITRKLGREIRQDAIQLWDMVLYPIWPWLLLIEVCATLIFVCLLILDIRHWPDIPKTLAVIVSMTLFLGPILLVEWAIFSWYRWRMERRAKAQWKYVVAKYGLAVSGTGTTQPAAASRPISCVYLIHNKKDGLVKIGQTSDFDRRFVEIQAGTEDKLEVVHIIKTPIPPAIESSLHKRYAHKRVHGEWFSLTDQDIHDIKRLGKSRK